MINKKYKEDFSINKKLSTRQHLKKRDRSEKEIKQENLREINVLHRWYNINEIIF